MIDFNSVFPSMQIHYFQSWSSQGYYSHQQSIGSVLLRGAKHFMEVQMLTCFQSNSYYHSMGLVFALTPYVE